MRGGKRQGSGRKKKPYKTVLMTFRVREEIKQQAKEAIKELIKNLTKILQNDET